MGEITIRNLITQVNSGSIRVPAFQRGFVWDPERVAFLMDSIYKEYPFGSVILWQTKEKLHAERMLGPFALPAPEADFPINYVLDGQQRITSIFGTFQTELEPAENQQWPNVYFDLKGDADLQESQFIVLDDENVDPGRHFPVKTFFDTVAYRKATRVLDDGLAEQIDKVQERFKEAKIPTQDIVTNNRDQVAIVFERVNRLGMELDVFQLLSAWTWSEDFDLQNKFEELAQELGPFGFDSIGEDSNLLLRCCAAVVCNDPSPNELMSISGAEVRDKFDAIENGVRGAIDFLRSNLNVERLQNLPYSSVLIPLSVFFAHPKGGSTPTSGHQVDVIKRWLWRSFFSRRFSAGVLRNLKRDITEIQKLKSGSNSTLDEIAVSIEPDFFRGRKFSVSAVDTKSFVLLLASQKPVSFVSGQEVSLRQVLSNYNRSEFHHLVPKAHAAGIKNKDYHVSSLANFAMISSADNKALGGGSPAQYRAKMKESAIAEILQHAICPASLFDGGYNAFIEERSSMLHEVALNLMGLDD